MIASVTMNLIFFVVVVTVFLSYSVAEPNTDLKMKYFQHIRECAEENSVSTEDMKVLAKQKTVQDNNAKCMLACTFKKTGMTDAEGKLSEKGAQEVAEKAYADDPEKLKLSEDFVKLCLRVNDEEIKGEKKECERAALIYDCFMEYLESIAKKQ